MKKLLSEGLYGLIRSILFFCALYVLVVAVAQASGDQNPAVSPTTAGKRIALVIGNSAYPGTAALKNPVNDATDIAGKLKKLGFDVMLMTDMPLRQMLRTLTLYGDKVRDGSEALFFYAGHGMQVRGKNYLIPIDAEISSESSVSSEAVDVDQLLDKLSPARLSMVILDACRNNPFERRFRGGGQGLAQINAPTGTLIAYATAPGKVASDGEGRNGLYTSELLNAMDVPGIRVEDVFKRVRLEVINKSRDTQTPWESSSLTGDFYFIPGDTTSKQIKEEREALQQELKKQKEAQDRAVDDVLRKATEQAARERLEFQKAMEKKLEEALARQATQLAEERAKRNEPANLESKPPILDHALSTNKAFVARPAEITTNPISERPKPGEQPSKLALTASATSAPYLPSNASEVAIDGGIRPGDEWEYSTRDDMFGKNGKLIMRVKAVSERGVLEEVIWNDKYSFEWAFGNGIAAVGTPNESEFLIAPHWKGDALKDVIVEGGIGFYTRPGTTFRIYNLKIIGTETLTLSQGIHEAIRIKGDMVGSVLGAGTAHGNIEFWYSTKFGRLLKQKADLRAYLQKYDETVELTAFRPAAR